MSNSSLGKLIRRNFFKHDQLKDLKLNVSNSGCTILLDNTNNNLIVELPFVNDSEGLFFNFLISEINSSNSIKISCKDGEQKLKIKNSLIVESNSHIDINTNETVRRWVGENIRIESNGAFWFLTDTSFNEASNSTSIENNSINNVITATGNKNIIGESNLTFDDSKLAVTGNISYNGSLSSSLGVTSVNNNLISSRRDIYSNNLKTSTFFESNFVQVGSDIIGQTSNENLGNTMTLNYNASILALGSSKLGRVSIYQWNGSSYIQTSSIQNSSSVTDHKSNMDLTSDGSIIVLSEPTVSSGAFTRNGSFSVYKWSGSTWSNLGNSVFGKRSNERFGYNVKINGNGTVIVASTIVQSLESDAPQESVRVYKIIDNIWTQMGADLSGLADDDYGISVAINGGGNIIAVGAPQRSDSSVGYIQILKWNSDAVIWEQMGSIKTGTFNFGNFVDLSFDGLVVATCSPGIINVSPAEGTTKDVSIYYFNGDDWIQKGSSIAGNSTYSNTGTLGLPLSLSADGNTIVVGSPYLNTYNKGKVRVYHFNGDWIQLGTDIDNTSGQNSEEFGYSVKLSKDGKKLIANAPNYDANNLGIVKVYNLQEDLSHVAVSNITNILTTSTITANSTIDFSIVNNIYYTVTFSGSDIELRAVNATNVGQQGYICFKFINDGYYLNWKSGGGSDWYAHWQNTSPNTNQSGAYSIYKYYIFETNKISLIGERTCRENS